MENFENNDRIVYLLSRYISLLTTKDEEKELFVLVAGKSDEQLSTFIESVWKSYLPAVPFSEEKSRKILNDILQEKTNRSPWGYFVKNPSWQRALSIAAMIAVVFCLGVLYWMTGSQRQSGKAQTVFVAAVEVSPDTPVDYIRNIVLPDSSVVILQQHSTLCGLENFNEGTRTLTLSGQAYFDVRENLQKPFVIHTGAITTTVLGTAFNIRAMQDENDVTVSVSKGRVKVANRDKVLAILTVNQELRCSSESEPKVVNTEAKKKIVGWTRQDMDFDHVSLKEVAVELSRRFGVNIAITGDRLADSAIVASFSGTESLEDILKILCAINSRTHYAVQDSKNIVISNEVIPF